MSLRIFSHTAFLAAISAAALAAGSGAAMAYPDKPITVLVGAGAGGSTDAGARIVAKAMQDILKQPLVVVNKTGGGGSKALVLLKDAKPDGYTLAFAYAHHVAFQPHYRRKTSLYHASDFTYIGSVTEPHMSIVSLASPKWKTLKEMVAVLRKENKPLRLVYSGGPGRLVGEAIAAKLGVPVKIIRVRGGGKSMQRVLGGHVDVVYSGGAHYKHTAAGKTQVIGTVSNVRNPDYPGAPTLKEMGVDAATPTAQILAAPKGIPDQVRSTLTAALIQVRKDPKIVALFSKNLQMPMDTRSQAQLASYMAELEKEYLTLIKNYAKEPKKKKKK